MKKLLFCFGTRPEAIKMAPLIDLALKRGCEVYTCVTGQHREMLVPFLEFFEIKPSINLDVMTENQTLSGLSAKALDGVSKFLESVRPDICFVQGDTTTTFISALASFYQKIPVAHVEAGLRTNDIYSPFPEEANRQMTSKITTYHFPPTEIAKTNLENEGIKENLWVTGNTSIDALKLTMEKIDRGSLGLEKKFPFCDEKFVLLTCHRRENFGEPIERICESVLSISKEHNLKIVFPVHMNPKVREVVNKTLGDNPNIKLLEPLDYVDFAFLMSKAHFIMTDSGGVQEEAPYFKKPVVVLRENTERMEGVMAKNSVLVGSDTKKIKEVVSNIMSSEEYYNSFSQNKNPYGDGEASEKILNSLGIN